LLGKAHLAIGSAIGLITAHYLGIQQTGILTAVIVTGLAAGLPDVLDSENAAGRDPMGVSWSGIKRDAKRKRLSVIEALLLIPRSLLAVMVDILARIIPHRGVTHWLITWSLLTILAGLVVLLARWGSEVALFFSLGYLSHLLADAMTVSGVKLFMPFYGKAIHLLPRLLCFRYDSPVQWLIVLAMWGLAIYPYRAQIVAFAEGLH